MVPPGYTPPPTRPPKKGLSTTAIVVIVVVAVVAATAVPAAILYVLVSGLTVTPGSTPYELGMTVVGGAGRPGPPPVYYVNLSLSPTLGLATAMFGLAVSNESSGTRAPVDAPSLGCTYNASASTECTSNGSGWYAVLLGPDGSVSATYGGSGGVGAWANLGGDVGAIAVQPGQRLSVVSGTDFATGEFLLTAFGTGTTVVSGGVEL